jgi:hypothetical protein
MAARRRFAGTRRDPSIRVRACPEFVEGAAQRRFPVSCPRSQVPRPCLQASGSWFLVRGPEYLTRSSPLESHVTRFTVMNRAVSVAGIRGCQFPVPVFCPQSLSPESQIPVCMLLSPSSQCQVTRFIIVNPRASGASDQFPVRSLQWRSEPESV